jgi:RNA polymerase sigma-B factor
MSEERHEAQKPTIAMGSAAEQDTYAMFCLPREARDLAQRDRFVCENLHLVYSVARRFAGLGESLDDLIQEGAIGLVNAVDLFDPARGVKFSTYASHLITGQIQHYLRDRGRLIRQPAWVQEMNTKVVRATEELTQELGREPQPAEIATRLNVTEESLQNVLAARELNRVQSLSSPGDGTGDHEGNGEERDTSADEKLENAGLAIEDRLMLDQAIDGLKTLEQRVVRLYFFQDMNQSEVARALHISVNYASYLLRRAVEKIKTAAHEQSILTTHPQPGVSMRPPEYQPTYDPVTGAYAGGYLQVRLAEEVARSQRFPTNFALMIVEVQGLPAGEDVQHRILAAVSSRLRSSTRVVDLVSYLGGTRFGLLLPHTGREAAVLGERICHRSERLDAQTSAEGTPITLHVGFAVFPIDGVHPEMLFRRAETALDEALRRNRRSESTDKPA